jgi:hypothetical protein
MPERTGDFAMAQEKALSNQELRDVLAETLGLLANVAGIVSDLATMGARHETPNVRHVADAREAVKKIGVLLATLGEPPASPPLT